MHGFLVDLFLNWSRPFLTSLNITNQSEYLDEPPMITVGCAELMGGIIGVPANLLVLYLWATMGRKGSTRYDETQRPVHNNNRWFIFGMTLADLIFTSIHSPMGAGLFIWNNDYQLSLCQLFYFCTHASITSSSINLLLLNIDKFLYLYTPLHYPNIVTKTRAVICLIFGWIIALSWATLFTFGPWLEFREKCSGVELLNPMEYIYFAVFFFFLPITASFCISCYIAYITIRASQGRTLGYDGSSGNISECSRGSRSSKTLKLTYRLKTILYIFTATMWSTVTCLPYRIVYTKYLMDGKKNFKYPWLFHIFYIMMIMTAVGNPFITIFTQPNYRKNLIAILGRKKKKENDSKSSLYISMRPVGNGKGNENENALTYQVN